MPTGTRPQPPTGACKVAVSGTAFGVHEVINVLWLKLTSAGTPAAADLTNVLTTLGTAWSADICPHLTSNYQFTSVDGVWITAPGTAITAHVATSTAGGAGTAPQDASICYVLDWLIGRYYRGGHPRSYLFGPETSAIANGSNVVALAQSGLTTGALAFLAAVNAASHGDITATQLGTYSFASSNAWRTTPVFEPYTGAKVRPFLGTQRRRIGGR